MHIAYATLSSGCTLILRNFPLAAHLFGDLVQLLGLAFPRDLQLLQLPRQHRHLRPHAFHLRRQGLACLLAGGLVRLTVYVQLLAASQQLLLAERQAGIPLLSRTASTW